MRLEKISYWGALWYVLCIGFLYDDVIEACDVANACSADRLENTRRISGGNHEETCPYGRFLLRWKDITKINLQGIGSKGVNEVYLVRPGSSGGSCEQGSKTLGPQSVENSFISCENFIFSRRTPLLWGRYILSLTISHPNTCNIISR